MYSKATLLSLKSAKTYLDTNKWLCFYHALSGDELKTQIFTVANKETDKMISYYYQDLSAKYKEFEEQGIKNHLKKDFEIDADDCLPCVINFLNDAKIEYTNKPYIK